MPDQRRRGNAAKQEAVNEHERSPYPGRYARPDHWGECVIRLLDRPPRLSVLDYLYYAGDDRFGALGVSASATTYQPREIGALPRLADVEAVLMQIDAEARVGASQK
jgi:hypothetical protein